MNSFWGAFIGSLMRPSVPLFAMMTGLLLLPVRESAKEFYLKRIPRVAIPMLIWSAVYYLIPWITGVVGLDKSVITTLFPFEFAPSQEAGDALKNIGLIHCSTHQCLFCCLVYRVIVAIFLNSIYMH